MQICGESFGAFILKTKPDSKTTGHLHQRTQTAPQAHQTAAETECGGQIFIKDGQSAEVN